MPKKPLSHITDPARIKATHERGDGFWSVVPPPRDAVVSCLRLYNESRIEWDEAPELGVLRAPFGHTVTSYALPIPDGTWTAMQRPRRVVEKIARLLWEEGRTDHALVRNIDRTMLADMIGVYLRYEGWAPPRGGERAAANALRAGLRYDLQGTHDKREVRQVFAIQIDGVVHVTTQYRDSPREVHHRSYDPGRETPGGHIGGDIVRPLLEVGYGLIRTLRPAYVNTPEGNV